MRFVYYSWNASAFLAFRLFLRFARQILRLSHKLIQGRPYLIDQGPSWLEEWQGF